VRAFTLARVEALDGNVNLHTGIIMHAVTAHFVKQPQTSSHQLNKMNLSSGFDWFRRAVDVHIDKPAPESYLGCRSAFERFQS